MTIYRKVIIATIALLLAIAAVVTFETFASYCAKTDPGTSTIKSGILTTIEFDTPEHAQQAKEAEKCPNFSKIHHLFQ